MKNAKIDETYTDSRTLRRRERATVAGNRQTTARDCVRAQLGAGNDDYSLVLSPEGYKKSSSAYSKKFFSSAAAAASSVVKQNYSIKAVSYGNTTQGYISLVNGRK